MSIFAQNFRAVVIGASGGIGGEVVRQLAQNKNAEKIYALSRKEIGFDFLNVHSLSADITDENSLEKAAAFIKNEGGIQLVFVATGVLHDGQNLQPEKSLNALTLDQMEHIFKVNTFGPALVAKHFLPLLDSSAPSFFVALSARVGSISDNHLGGWHSYRASKAALNMLLRCMSIEVARRNKKAVILGLHPGTVETKLSAPFQKNVPEGKLFTPEYSVRQMLDVIKTARPEHSGHVFDFAGKEIHP